MRNSTRTPYGTVYGKHQDETLPSPSDGLSLMGDSIPKGFQCHKGTSIENVLR